MILVAGPSCGGKTTFVRTHAREDEAILDFGDILEELGDFRYAPSPETTEKAQLVWKERLPLADWVIWNAPRREDRGRFRSQHQAKVYVVLASFEMLLDRAKRERPPGWERYILQWWYEYRPSSSGSEEVIWTG